MSPQVLTADDAVIARERWHEDGHLIQFVLIAGGITSEIICPGARAPCRMANGKCEVKEWHDGDPGVWLDCMEADDDLRLPINGPVRIAWRSFASGGSEPEWDLWWKPLLEPEEEGMGTEGELRM